MTLLSATQVSRQYRVGERSLVALHPVSIDVDEGEFKVVIGPSGVGKSTLLQLLSGLDRPTTGTVLLRDKDIYQLGDCKLSELRNHSFGFVFQTPYMLPHKTVLQNVLLSSLYASVSGEYVQRARELLAYVGLAALETRSPATLSGGELQRAGFARALLMNPAVIFADEPTGSLDRATSKLILDLLREQTESGRAVIMATHDPHAMAYGSERLVLEKW